MDLCFSKYPKCAYWLLLALILKLTSVNISTYIHTNIWDHTAYYTPWFLINLFQCFFCLMNFYVTRVLLYNSVTSTGKSHPMSRVIHPHDWKHPHKEIKLKLLCSCCSSCESVIKWLRWKVLGLSFVIFLLFTNNWLSILSQEAHELLP